MREILIIFQKNPVSGKVKTRLAKDVGDVEALAIYQQLIRYTKTVVDPLLVEKQIWYSNQLEEDIWDDSVYKKFVQSGENLGERMMNAFDCSLSEKEESKVVIIGTDCGELTSEIIRQGFDQLNNQDFVIGPASDGGYYLLGMKSRTPEIFSDIAWSTAEVGASTIKKIESLNRTFFRLPMLSDVDTLEDWDNIKERISEY